MNSFYRNYEKPDNDMWLYNKPIHTFWLMDNIIVKPAKIMNIELMREIVYYDNKKNKHG